MSDTASLHDALRTIPDFPKPGIQFKDITPILGDPNLLSAALNALADPYESMGITKVVGIEARGFLLGPLLAQRLNVGFVPIRKEGKLPATTHAASYELEYGTDTIEIHTDGLAASDRVLIHDDLLATGGTAAAAAQLVHKAEATLQGYSFLVELAFLKGREQLPEADLVHSVLVE